MSDLPHHQNPVADVNGVDNGVEECKTHDPPNTSTASTHTTQPEDDDMAVETHPLHRLRGRLHRRRPALDDRYLVTLMNVLIVVPQVYQTHHHNNHIHIYTEYFVCTRQIFFFLARYRPQLGGTINKVGILTPNLRVEHQD